MLFTLKNLIISWTIATDLRSNFPPVFDQGLLRSCTSNAIASVYMYKTKTSVIPSRLQLYWEQRFRTHTVLYDSGSYIRDGIDILSHHGLCDEKTWSYDTNFLHLISPPSLKCTKESFNKPIVSHSKRIALDINDIKNELRKDNPVLIEFKLFDSIYQKNTYDFPMPSTNEHYHGNHAVVIVGFNDLIGRFILRNSWGKNYGNNGYFTLPYDFFNPSYAYVHDLWTIDDITILKLESTLKNQ